MDRSWARIPSAISAERDRRELCAILAGYGLEVRIVRERIDVASPFAKYIEKAYVEYCEQPYLLKDQ